MKKKLILIDRSRLVIESLALSGCNVFVAYPITPANLIYKYATERFSIVQEAPDEISTLQWMSGYSAAGHIPVTATSFPGFALMIESINMAYMMELPMIVILVQRLGPSTGTATCGAQGDISLLKGVISGGHALPTFCLSNAQDSWELSSKAVKVASDLRTPVVILTSKEMMMPLCSFDTRTFCKIKPVKRSYYNSKEEYIPYKPHKNLVPPFLAIGNDEHRVRLTASTHDMEGILRHSSKEALANSARLNEKVVTNARKYSFYEFDEEPGADTLILSYGITSEDSREAVLILRQKRKKVSLLIVKTIIPVLPEYHEITNKYKNVIVAEENLTGQLRQMLWGTLGKKGVIGVNKVGKLISPRDIIKEIK